MNSQNVGFRSIKTPALIAAYTDVYDTGAVFVFFCYNDSLRAVN